MILKRVHVQNFRSIKDAVVELGRQTAILGTNGAGKSTILRAIDKFYGPSTNVDLDDFFARDLTKEIRIALTFCAFNATEQTTFQSRVHNDEMTVVRVFDASNPRNNGRYYGMTMQVPAFASIRSLSTFTAKREQLTKLRESDPRFGGLPSVRSVDHLEQVLAAWESSHPTELDLCQDDGQFFGFTNVAKGSLQKATNFVFIPAVRDATADAVDARGAVIAKLMELVVRSAIQKRSEIQEFQSQASAKFRELTDPSNLPELGFLSDNLTHTLQLFYADAGVGLKWKAAEDLVIPLPVSDVSLREDGFEGPVDRKGHGLQRAFIFTLLQHLAQASALNSSSQEGEHTRNQTIEVETQSDDSAASSLMPGLILAIEEPELYQHPTKQRHFAKVLTRLSDGTLPGVAAQTQIVFASHSSLFVSIERFEEIRLARRRRVNDCECKECVLLSSKIENIARKLDEIDGVAIGTNSPAGLLSRLHVINAEIAEGFFADGVVLVEGESDRAAIKAAASLFDYDPEELGIAVLQVGGKTNLPKISLIFKELEIPVFAIWDCDAGLPVSKRAENINVKLQKIFGCKEENIVGCITRVTKSYACFEDKLETCLQQEFGAERYGQLLDEARDNFGLKDRAGVSKSSAAMTHVVRTATSEGLKSATIFGIVQGIKQMRLDNYPVVDEGVLVG